MTDHGDQLREAFQTHEHLAPDPAAVYDRVQDLSRTYRRRRRGAQTAGGAVLGVGLLAGALSVPSLLPDRPDPAAVVIAPAAQPSPSVASVPPSAAPSQAEIQAAWDAYFRAGYGYDEAVKLAKAWNSSDRIGDVKAEAGRRLLAGETLPVRPSSKEEAADAEETARIDAFFAAGYDFADAEKLARLWKSSSPYAAKSEAGARLLAGRKLPIKPKPVSVETARETKRVDAFFAAGYDYDDAVKLARIWKKSDAYQAKIEGGKRLLAGQSLPIRP